jgi:hypothetical protein
MFGKVVQWTRCGTGTATPLCFSGKTAMAEGQHAERELADWRLAEVDN